MQRTVVNRDFITLDREGDKGQKLFDCAAFLSALDFQLSLQKTLHIFCKNFTLFSFRSNESIDTM